MATCEQYKEHSERETTVGLWMGMVGGQGTAVACMQDRLGTAQAELRGKALHEPE